MFEGIYCVHFSFVFINDQTKAQLHSVTQLCVCHRGEVCLPNNAMGRQIPRLSAPEDRPLSKGRPPRKADPPQKSEPPHPQDTANRRAYASYWNVYLSFQIFVQILLVFVNVYNCSHFDGKERVSLKLDRQFIFLAFPHSSSSACSGSAPRSSSTCSSPSPW